jgi:L-amino acid N-acyltransferase YncA
LVEKTIADSPRLNVRALVGYVLGHNEASLGLFESAGFARWGCLPRIAKFETSERDLVIVGRHVG